MGFYTEEVKNNWEEFPGKKLSSIPNKYFDKYSREGTKYDHMMVFRDKEYDYVVISNYPCEAYHKELLEEGFVQIDKDMYSTSCESYYKLFKNNKRKNIEEIK